MQLKIQMNLQMEAMLSSKPFNSYPQRRVGLTQGFMLLKLLLNQ
jgi:hypothetical protein